jgi:ATP-dependent helicase/nuclease subunit A
VLYGINVLFKGIMKKECGGIEYDERARLNPGFAWPEPRGEDVGGNSQGDSGVDENASGFHCDATRVGGKINAYLVNTKGDGEGRTARECEAAQLAAIISEMVDQERGRLVYDADKGEYRAARLSDIVILVRSIKGFGREYADALMNAGIPAGVQSTGGYYDTFEIEQILNVLAIIDNPRQDIPLAAACVSYFGTLKVEQLAAIKAVTRKRSLYDSMAAYARDNADDISARIGEMSQRLLEWRRMAERSSIYDLIWRIVYDTGFYDYISHMPSGSLRTTNVDMFLEKAKSYGRTSYHGLFNFLRYIDRVKKYDIDNDGGAQDSASDMVRIMSIHKSKGLEFPIVIVAGMSKQFNMRDSRDKVVIDADLGIGVDSIDPVARTRFKPYCKGAIETKLELDSLAEEIRILYVAMTRAKEQLVLVGAYSGKEDAIAKWKAVEEFSYADIRSCKTYYDMVMPVAFRHPEVYEVHEVTPENVGEPQADGAQEVGGVHEAADGEQEVGGVQEAADGEQDVNGVRELVGALPPYIYEYATTMKGKMSVSEIKQAEHGDIQEDNLYEERVQWAMPETMGDAYDPVIPQFINDRQPVLPTQRGTAFHRVMECLDYARVETMGQLGEQMDEMERKGLINEKQRMSVDVEKIWHFCESDLGRRVKAAYQKEQVYRERPFVMGIKASELKQYRQLLEAGSVTAGQLDGEQILIQGVIDLYFVENGHIILVDYKTDRVDRLDTLADRYRVQLEYYANALNRVSQLEVQEKLIYSFCLDDVLAVE